VERTIRLASQEQARNAAIQWLENHGAVFGPHRKVEIGRLGVLAGAEVGTSASQSPFWRIRLDYDPAKGPHFNAEFGRGPSRSKAAFCFPGTEELIRKLSTRRAPR
jgi:hypothetical protein